MLQAQGPRVWLTCSRKLSAAAGSGAGDLAGECFCDVYRICVRNLGTFPIVRACSWFRPLSPPWHPLGTSASSAPRGTGLDRHGLTATGPAQIRCITYGAHPLPSPSPRPPHQICGLRNPASAPCTVALYTVGGSERERESNRNTLEASLSWFLLGTVFCV